MAGIEKQGEGKVEENMEEVCEYMDEEQSKSGEARPEYHLVTGSW